MFVYLFNTEYFQKLFSYSLLIYIYLLTNYYASWHMILMVLREFMDSFLLRRVPAFCFHGFFNFLWVLYFIIFFLLLLISIMCSILFLARFYPWLPPYAKVLETSRKNC